MNKTKTGLVDKRTIRDFCLRIAKEFHPDKIILFGSYADGNPTPDSDVDLMVIMPFQGHPANKATEIRLRVSPPFPLDLILRTPEKIQERLALKDDFIKDILEEGKVLYEADREALGLT